MPWWNRLLDILHLPRIEKRPKTERGFALDEGVLQSLHELAARENRPPDELARHLLTRALREQQADEVTQNIWLTLTPREQQVVALMCLRYTNAQIAARLNISYETVKTHVHNALTKFGAPNREKLRLRMFHWDFTGWDEMP